MGLSSDVTSYSSATSACATGVEWVLPFESLKEIRHCNPKPDAVSHSTVISVCVFVRDGRGLAVTL